MSYEMCADKSAYAPVPISELHAETIGPTRVCSKRGTFKLEIEVGARLFGCKLIHALLGNSGV